LVINFLIMNNWQNITDTRLVRPIHPGEVIANILDDLSIDNTKKALYFCAFGIYSDIMLNPEKNKASK
jgi:hypothetical protein